jgi:hypothetical protein
MNTHTEQWKSRLLAVALGVGLLGFAGAGAYAQNQANGDIQAYKQSQTDAETQAYKESQGYATKASAAMYADMGYADAGQSQNSGTMTSTADGDKVTVPLTDPSRPATVRAGVLFGSITVKGYDGKEVIVEAHIRPGDSRRFDRDDERAGRRDRGDNGDDANTQGMKRLSVSSTGLSVEEENNEVHVGTDRISASNPVDITISVPRQTSLVLRSTNSGTITVSDVNGDIDVNNTNGPVMIDHVSGSVLAHALNGRIHVTFDKVSAKPMAFSSLNGAIDVTFPPDLKANLTIRDDRGDVFSDFDVQLTTGQNQVVQDDRKDGGVYKVKIDRTIHASVGGGGPEIQFTNMNGNIYIRKTGSASASSTHEN